jgi:hypothetical protein
MNEFFKKVTRDLAAKQVVVFIDACHAAGASEGARDPLSIDVEKEWNALKDKQGQFTMALFSSLSYQKSWEDSSLGGGHGLFTWFLLQGLKGAAPATEKGWITSSSLWNYVKDEVEKASRMHFPEVQTPSASPGFRTEFPLAYTTPDSFNNTLTRFIVDASTGFHQYGHKGKLAEHLLGAQCYGSEGTMSSNSIIDCYVLHSKSLAEASEKVEDIVTKLYAALPRGNWVRQDVDWYRATESYRWRAVRFVNEAQTAVWVELVDDGPPRINEADGVYTVTIRVGRDPY